MSLLVVACGADEEATAVPEPEEVSQEEPAEEPAEEPDPAAEPAEGAAEKIGRGCMARRVDVTKPDQLSSVLADADACINSAQYCFNLEVMAGCLRQRGSLYKYSFGLRRITL